MQNLWTIFRRELAAYYTSAIGYIFLIVFLSLSVGFFMTPFFTFLSADMRAFFSTVPILMCIFLPAVTMRLWAEERKQNTWEMLLTFPMQPHELVLGKFAASFTFFLSALAGTLTIPLMLAILGHAGPGSHPGGVLWLAVARGFLSVLRTVHLGALSGSDRGLCGDVAGLLWGLLPGYGVYRRVHR